jgi:methyl-accepting chemotaxis protein
MGLNVEVLEQSFKAVSPKADALVSRFYERLFQKYPAVKPLFKDASMADQKKKLLASLVLVIQNLRKPDKLTEALQAMGARHVGYGALPAHYDAVGENLLAVLAEFAGPAWTPAVKQAWTEAYGAIKTIMLQGAARHHGGARSPVGAPQRARQSSEGGGAMLAWFGNLKTMWKLMAGFALMGAIMCVLGWVAGQGLMAIRENLRVVYEDYTVAGTDLAMVAGNLNRTRTNDFLAFEASSKAEFDRVVSRDAEITESVKKPLEAYAATVLRVSKTGRDEARDLQKFRDAYARYVTTSDSLYETLRQAWRAQTKAEMDSLRAKAYTITTQQAGPAMETTIVALSELIMTVKDVAKDMNDDGRAAAANALFTLAIGTGVAVMGGLFLGWLIGCFLSRNLANVIKAAQALGGGDLKARSSLTTQDEVGILAQAFNAMGEQVEASVIEQQQRAAVSTALEKVQAVIEFNLDGTVLTANEIFLHTLGYSLDEITGRHHRMFCDAAYTNSQEYQGFWAKLNRGELDAGVYRRLGKGGNEVWIQASYNPVFDANGKPCKVVKFATDITAEKNRNAEFESKIAAIGKTQAVIEFNLDGTVLTANEIFLHTLGYSLDEITGRHHRMFCDAAYTNSQEYQGFWAKLNRGEFDAGVYHRVGKGGKEVWIQASYNPILDANGKPYKVVKFATDITGQKRAQNEVEKLIKAAATGQLSERIKTEAFTGASKELTNSFNRLLDSVTTPLHEAQTVLTALSKGDLRTQMTGTYEGEFELMKTSLNVAIANLTTTLSTVRTAAESVSTGAEQITKGNEDLSQRTSEQASSLEETSSAMEEMTSTVKQNADNAKQANQLAIAARDVAEKGGAVTAKAIDAMSEINKSSKKIADIITVIDEIAFQTNLLALNAAVEAARAGEHGRGFAVVAAEVRNLAQRSATAAKEIKGLINESVQRVTDGSELVDQSGKTLTEIVGSVKRVTDIIAEIAAASQEQASGIDQVNKAIMQMDETTQQNAALVEEATSASQSMKEQAKELMNQVAAFKMMGGGPESPGRLSGAARPSFPSAGPMKKPLLKKPAMPSKAHQERVAVASGNGKVRGQKDNEFEEF